MRLRSGVFVVIAMATLACTNQSPDQTSPPPPPTATPAAATDAKAPATPPPPGATLAPPHESFKEFDDQLKKYLALRDKVEDGLPKLTETKDPKKIAERAAMLATGIREARHNAKQGDIFTPTVTAEFRRILKEDAAARTKTDKTNIMAEVPEKAPMVNALYPTDSPKGPAALPSFPPNLLAVLPVLPETVEYRFLSNALVLRDASANLIIDYLPSSAPARSGGGGGPR